MGQQGSNNHWSQHNGEDAREGDGGESETEAAAGKNHVWLPWNQQKLAERKLMVWIPD